MTVSGDVDNLEPFGALYFQHKQRGVSMSIIKNPEIGSAGIRVDLTDGVITVYHSEGDAVLAKWKAELGDWDKLWNCINDMVDKSEGFRLNA